MDSYSNNARNIFLKNLALALTKPLMEKRMKNDHLPKDLRVIICKTLGVEKEENLVIEQSKGKKRCYYCDRKKDKKGQQFCIKCDTCICSQHSKILCPCCFYDMNLDEM